jgi:hypothetical protein
MTHQVEDPECPFLGEFGQRFEHLEGDIQEIRKALLGNGRPGVLDRLGKTEVQVKVLWGVMGALGTGIILVAARLLEKLF